MASGVRAGERLDELEESAKELSHAAADDEGALAWRHAVIRWLRGGLDDLSDEETHLVPHVKRLLATEQEVDASAVLLRWRDFRAPTLKRRAAASAFAAPDTAPRGPDAAVAVRADDRPRRGHVRARHRPVYHQAQGAERRGHAGRPRADAGCPRSPHGGSCPSSLHRLRRGRSRRHSAPALYWRQRASACVPGWTRSSARSNHCREAEARWASAPFDPAQMSQVAAMLSRALDELGAQRARLPEGDEVAVVAESVDRIASWLGTDTGAPLDDGLADLLSRPDGIESTPARVCHRDPHRDVASEWVWRGVTDRARRALALVDDAAFRDEGRGRPLLGDGDPDGASTPSAFGELVDPGSGSLLERLRGAFEAQDARGRARAPDRADCGDHHGRGSRANLRRVA